MVDNQGDVVARITIYLRAGCKHCADAVRMLKDQGHQLKSISISGSGSITAIGSGASHDTHPVIFVGDKRLNPPDALAMFAN
ncbi:glutaredoxin domain-containing protein [Paraburkholderia tropica]|uniref:glutaredoxin domain-containing protein n=1 Tax=Paraburkholderia tropica TaxID=92647 RepID=UPI003D279882